MEAEVRAMCFEGREGSRAKNADALQKLTSQGMDSALDLAGGTSPDDTLILSKGVQPTAHCRRRPRMAVNAAQHKIVNLLKTL